MAVTRGSSGWAAGLGPFTVDAGSDRCLLYADSWENSPIANASAVTYGGKAMTKIIDAITPNTFGGTSIWRLLEADIPTGSNSLVVTRPAAPSCFTEGYGSYNGVNQTTPVDATAADATNSPVITLTINLTVLKDSMSVARVHSGAFGEFTWANSYIDQLDHNEPSCSGSTADKAETAAGTSTITPTKPDFFERMALNACSLAQASAPPPATTIIRPCCAQLIT